MKVTKEMLAVLRKQADLAHKAHRNALWKYERETAYPRALGLIGSIWTVKNNYSCPGPDDYWTVFMRITIVRPLGLRYDQMQIDKNGQLMIERNISAPFDRFLDGRYERATVSDWKQELKRVKELVGNLEPKKLWERASKK